ncbi:rhomboid family intramembrane serine protease [Deinococcus deserti]|uniref:Putative Rhomboid-like protein putative membrane protein n=1 Tax=Deinococcus deserti (strain DSM 17065 / CIP 109153 / LMG 22923 / VCD115) TaxID=546414 RepID=C1CWH2_DEIDV|nr:rhomboid family intramembrane serine protease [Deinococcus deserti]ACO46539.1 putative Rhomboid-like protein; putative membrane protein [Deinococcus deserti VCD115]
MRRPGPSAARPASARRAGSPVAATILTAILTAGLWTQEVVDTFAFGGQLDAFGIQPRDPDSLAHVFSAPFLHAGFAHLMANTVPLAVLTFMSAVRGIGRFLVATLLIVLVGGGLVWLFGRGNSIHLGASALVFGYLAYLLGVGWWERTPAALGMAAVAFLLYGGALWGVLPGNPVISWEAHLFGFVAGLLAAALLHRRRPVLPGTSWQR